MQFVDQSNAAALTQALARKPKLLLIETPSNPLVRVVDIAHLCQLAKAQGTLVAVDNTFLTPVFQKTAHLRRGFCAALHHQIH